MTANQPNAMRQEKKLEELDVFFAEIISQSLCVNCTNLNDCIYLARASAPIHTCELHECADMSKPGLVAVSRPETPGELGSGETGLLGLCVNCDNRESCGFQKPVSGVWHCEEYC
jgi:hypothetical protein